MDNGLYITLSRQLALFRDMDVTAHNIANTNSTGFNSEHVLFTSYLNQDVNQGVPNKMAFAHDVATYRNTATGAMQQTGNQLDVAINGQGYFMVETPLGVRYTRAGNFQLDGEGLLVNGNGYPVLDASGQRIVFPDNVNTIEIGSLGNVKVNGDDFGSIGVAQFDNEQLLERTGNGLYKSEVNPLPAGDVRVIQGAIESSNVRPVLELTHMIKVSRAVGSTARFIEAINELQRKTSDAWARQGQ